MEVERRNELRKLCEAAANGPWEAKGEDGDYPVVDVLGREVASGYDRDTARFVAAARTGVPELLNMIGKLLDGRDSWDAEAEHLEAKLEETRGVLIERWHASGSAMPAHEWMGMTWKEYAEWVECRSGSKSKVVE